MTHLRGFWPFLSHVLLGLLSASVGQGVPAVDRAALVADSQSGSWDPKKKDGVARVPLVVKSVLECACSCIDQAVFVKLRSLECNAVGYTWLHRCDVLVVALVLGYSAVLSTLLIVCLQL